MLRSVQHEGPKSRFLSIRAPDAESVRSLRNYAAPFF